ncbi:MAG: Bax inhibitor-1 family protein [Phycisphaerae bacterium]|nr:Bax inhibitor-1/YccA family protein [Tepidisphaeraceae bacterium]
MSMYPQPGQQPMRRPYELEYANDNRAVSNFFNMVYAWMAVGLALTAAVAYMVAQTDFLYRTPKGMFAIFGLAAFGISLFVQFQAGKISANLSTVLFLLYAGILGVLLSGIFLVYSPKTLLSAFLLTGGVFGGMSVYGFITKKDLSRMGSILIMCFWGLFLASIVNIFVANNAMSWLITYGILIVFIGLTAYETQQLKEIAYAVGTDATMAPRMAIYGSLILYISFINIFLSILRILGDRE